MNWGEPQVSLAANVSQASASPEARGSYVAMELRCKAQELNVREETSPPSALSVPELERTEEQKGQGHFALLGK